MTLLSFSFYIFCTMKTNLLDHLVTSTILKPNYRRFDIEGAPFKIGSKVQVLNNPLNDETFDKKYSHKIGEIMFFEYDCGCGQTFPVDPMIGVKFLNGKVAEFWKEELLLIL